MTKKVKKEDEIKPSIKVKKLDFKSPMEIQLEEYFNRTIMLEQQCAALINQGGILAKEFQTVSILFSSLLELMFSKNLITEEKLTETTKVTQEAYQRLNNQVDKVTSASFKEKHNKFLLTDFDGFGKA